MFMEYDMTVMERFSDYFDFTREGVRLASESEHAVEYVSSELSARFEKLFGNPIKKIKIFRFKVWVSIVGCAIKSPAIF